MKAAELMIGDWVHVDGVQVDDVNGKPVYELIARRVKALWKGTITLDDDYEMPAFGCVPIPLTEDIIKKNGFEIKDEYVPYRHEDARYYRIEKGNDICLEVDAGGVLLVAIYEGYTGSFESFVINQLRYVHELQHALRLCGVDKEIVL